MSTSIDELFKSAGTSSKRKLETTKNPEEVYKAAKLAANGSSRNAAVEEEEEDIEAGPALPPEDDEVDDEEGRFFGGGVSKDTADVLDFLDEQDVADDKGT
jgi:beta-catenin-like protein 1